MQPGKKGIALTPDEWDKLCAAAPQLSQHLQASGSQAGGSAAAAAAAAGAGTSSKAAAGGAAGGAAAAPAAAAAGGGVELSSARRADVSTYKGTTYVNIREYYEKVRGCSTCAFDWPHMRVAVGCVVGLQLLGRGCAGPGEPWCAACRALPFAPRIPQCCFAKFFAVVQDGQKLPGKKGISLPRDQFEALRCAVRLAGCIGSLPGLDCCIGSSERGCSCCINIPPHWSLQLSKACSCTQPYLLMLLCPMQAGCRRLGCGAAGPGHQLRGAAVQQVSRFAWVWAGARVLLCSSGSRMLWLRLMRTCCFRMPSPPAWAAPRPPTHRA